MPIVCYTEQWRPVAGYEDSYEVSHIGRVRSVGRWRNTRRGESNRWQPGKLLKQEKRSKYGHRRVTLYNNRNPVRRAVHQLVLEAFVGPRPDGLWVLHRDGNPSNNHVRNLYFGTPSENQYDRVRHGNNHHALKSTCPHGHPLDGERYLHGKFRSRFCKTCMRIRSQRVREGRKQLQGASA